MCQIDKPQSYFTPGKRCCRFCLKLRDDLARNGKMRTERARSLTIRSAQFNWRFETQGYPVSDCVVDRIMTKYKNAKKVLTRRKHKMKVAQ